MTNTVEIFSTTKQGLTPRDTVTKCDPLTAHSALPIVEGLQRGNSDVGREQPNSIDWTDNVGGVASGLLVGRARDEIWAVFGLY